MSIPTQTEMFKIVLETFAVYPRLSRMQTKRIVGENLHLSREERNRVTSSGVPVYESRVGWAISWLNDVDYLVRVERGVYSITELGREILKFYPELDDFIEKLRRDREERFSYGNVQEVPPQEIPVHGHQDPLMENRAVPPPEVPGSEDFSPVERIDAAVTEMLDQLSAELMNAIMRNEGREGDTFFEKIVTDLLEKMGYGKGTVTPPSNDGGIDGIIKTDPLGFDPILIQAKRYSRENTVGRPEVQRFAGALGAVTRGAFITTSQFSPGAVQYAKAYPHADIVLIDGKKLTELMIRYNVGVSTEREILVKRIDNDYFEL